MSIWTDLLFLHGHIATPAALALIAPVAACTTAAAPEPPAPRRAAEADHGDAVFRHHPLRVTGQLR